MVPTLSMGSSPTASLYNSFTFVISPLRLPAHTNVASSLTEILHRRYYMPSGKVVLARSWIKRKQIEQLSSALPIHQTQIGPLTCRKRSCHTASDSGQDESWGGSPRKKIKHHADDPDKQVNEMTALFAKVKLWTGPSTVRACRSKVALDACFRVPPIDESSPLLTSKHNPNYCKYVQKLNGGYQCPEPMESCDFPPIEEPMRRSIRRVLVPVTPEYWLYEEYDPSARPMLTAAALGEVGPQLPRQRSARQGSSYRVSKRCSTPPAKLSKEDSNKLSKMASALHKTPIIVKANNNQGSIKANFARSRQSSIKVKSSKSHKRVQSASRRRKQPEGIKQRSSSSAKLSKVGAPEVHHHANLLNHGAPVSQNTADHPCVQANILHSTSVSDERGQPAYASLSHNSMVPLYQSIDSGSHAQANEVALTSVPPVSEPSAYAGLAHEHTAPAIQSNADESNVQANQITPTSMPLEQEQAAHAGAPHDTTASTTITHKEPDPAPAAELPAKKEQPRLPASKTKEARSDKKSKTPSGGIGKPQSKKSNNAQEVLLKKFGGSTRKSRA